MEGERIEITRVNRRFLLNPTTKKEKLLRDWYEACYTEAKRTYATLEYLFENRERVPELSELLQEARETRVERTRTLEDPEDRVTTNLGQWLVELGDAAEGCTINHLASVLLAKASEFNKTNPLRLNLDEIWHDIFAEVNRPLVKRTADHFSFAGGEHLWRLLEKTKVNSEVLNKDYCRTILDTVYIQEKQAALAVNENKYNFGRRIWKVIVASEETVGRLREIERESISWGATDFKTLVRYGLIRHFEARFPEQIRPFEME